VKYSVLPLRLKVKIKENLRASSNTHIHGNVLARKGIYPTKMTKVLYPYITEWERPCSNVSANSLTSNCEQYITRLGQKNLFHRK